MKRSCNHQSDSGDVTGLMSVLGQQLETIRQLLTMLNVNNQYGTRSQPRTDKVITVICRVHFISLLTVSSCCEQ